MTNQKLGYPDLRDKKYVFEALLGYGMFNETLPPCFTSKIFFEGIKKNIFKMDELKDHAPVDYRASRNTNIPRSISIPHPESYWHLCKFMKDYWGKINEHIGKPEIKMGYCHVRKIRGENHIFEMDNYLSTERKKEEIGLDYALGCKYVVKADISNFFLSIYSHSIPWAIDGKNTAKRNLSEDKETWANYLDKYSRSLKNQETNGLLIGPHTSNIISEIILTEVDSLLQGNGYKKVIRHIDDYLYYAKDERDANDFLMNLGGYLKEFELHLNPKKTEIISINKFRMSDWKNRLLQFKFPDKDVIGFTSINAYIDYALEIAEEFEGDYAVLNYAIKVVSGKELSLRAKELYIKKILSLSSHRPYLLRILETYVFNKFADKGSPDYFKNFLKYQLEIALQHGFTDALAFVFYYAIRYKVEIPTMDEKKVVEEIINLNDCISMTLAYEYLKSLPSHHTNLFEEKAREINQIYVPREIDRFWLFLYQALGEDELKDEFLRKLKRHQVEFIKFQE